jgi:hypothetical protein
MAAPSTTRSVRRADSRSLHIAIVNGFSACLLSPNLSLWPANGSQFQPTPANSPPPVRVSDFKDLRRKKRRPRSEVSVLANRRLQPLGHLTVAHSEGFALRLPTGSLSRLASSENRSGKSRYVRQARSLTVRSRVRIELQVYDAA